MKPSKYAGVSLFRHVAVALAAIASVAACTASQAPRDELLATTSSPLFTNGGFETGAAGAAPPSWIVQPFLNDGITVQTPQTRAGLDLVAGGKALTTVLNGVNQPDPDLGAAASLRWPKYGNQCAIVNSHSSTTFGNGKNVNAFSQTMTIGAGDVDPLDGKVHVRFVVAPVLQNPAHTANEQPYYLVQLTDVTQGTLLYSDFNLSGAAGIPWKTVRGGTAMEIDYTDWQVVDITPVAGTLAMGDMVTLAIIASGCSPGGHFGEIYVDGAVSGPVLPGIFVVGSGPAQANACSNITYDLAYRNGAATAAAGVTVTFNTPPNTTYQSFAAPGLTCTTPAVGAAGVVTCTVGNLAAGAGGSFTVTVNITCGTTGTIVAGNYFIAGTGIEALLGPHVITSVGCTRDSQCPAGQWCDETLIDCTPTLANGTAIPTDLPHTNPTLAGLCTAAAGALVCTSAVCDTKDSECGFANGDGPCTAVDGPVVCRSTACSTNGTCEPAGGCNVDADCAGGWCAEATHTCMAKVANGLPIPNDPPHAVPTLDGTCTAPAGALVCMSAVCDLKDNDCGYANGDGPCTIAGGGTVCRSGNCSANGTCEAAGACDVDADCTAEHWCDESTHICMAQIPNGGPIPTDAAHMNPTLDGTCTLPAGALVCVSAVCDAKDNECGYANGDGPCTPLDGSTVCRSTACSANGTCEPVGACNVDGDCTSSGMPHCNTTTHLCQAAADAGVDAGAGDASRDSGTAAEDAAASSADATVEEEAPDQSGFVEGGGVSCSVGRAKGAPTTMVGLLLVTGLGLGARRRRRGR
jgi:MYXO-CTERM domain-containing protein